MDPNTTLAQIRVLIASASDESNRDRNADAFDALEAVIALDEWLSRGGFLPRAWVWGR